MEPDQLTKLLEVIVSLVQALSWPLLVLFILLYFSDSLRRFMRDVGEFTFKAGPTGVEASAKKQEVKAAALLGAAAASKPAGTLVSFGPPTEDSASQIADVVVQATKPRIRRRLSDASVLWVDDNPQNNSYERSALEALGMHITLSESTEDAAKKMRMKKYDVIISDMKRSSDETAGYKLLEEKQKMGDTTPYIIYASSNLPEHRAEARRRGALGSTNNPQELVELVLDAMEAS